MRRLGVFAGIIGYALFALAHSATAQTMTRTIPAKALFPYLEAYYRLPGNARDHFHLDYVFVSKSPPSLVHIVLKRKSGDMPLPIAPDGHFPTLPTAFDIASETATEVTAPKGAQLGMTILLVETMEPARILDVAALKVGIDQARNGSKKAAGLLAVAVPDYRVVCFAGAHSGTVTLQGGGTLPLRTFTANGKPGAGTPCFAPEDQPTATQITLDQAPSAMHIVGK
jgi:hypothetical protein